MAARQELNSDDVFLRRVIAIFARDEEVSFEEAVRQYRQIEAEFVALAGDDHVTALDRKRTISAHLLMDADREEQPHEVCLALWDGLLQLGFWDVTMRHTMSNTYARCCLKNSAFDAGISVLEPHIAELKERLAQPELPQPERAFCEQFISMHEKLRDELKAGIRE